MIVVAKSGLATHRGIVDRVRRLDRIERSIAAGPKEIALVEIIAGRLSDPQVVHLLGLHLSTARAQTAPESAHALDLSGLQAPEISFWSAWEQGQLLAVGALKRLSTAHGEVKSMHTAEAARRRGIGSAMLRHIIDVARMSGMTRLSLETGSSAYFKPARALYTRHGFVASAPFDRYRPDPNSSFFTLDL